MWFSVIETLLLYSKVRGSLLLLAFGEAVEHGSTTYSFSANDCLSYVVQEGGSSHQTSA